MTNNKKDIKMFNVKIVKVTILGDFLIHIPIKLRLAR